MSKRPPLPPSSPPPGKRMADAVSTEQADPAPQPAAQRAAGHTPAKIPSLAAGVNTDLAAHLPPDDETEMKTRAEDKTDALPAVGAHHAEEMTPKPRTDQATCVGVASASNPSSGTEAAVNGGEDEHRSSKRSGMHRHPRDGADKCLADGTGVSRAGVTVGDDSEQGVPTANNNGDVQKRGEVPATDMQPARGDAVRDGEATHRTLQEEARNQGSEGGGETTPEVPATDVQHAGGDAVRDGEAAHRTLQEGTRNQGTEGGGETSPDKFTGETAVTAERSLRDYVAWRVRVTVSKLKTPRYTLRPTLVNDAAVESFKNLFLESEYGEGERVISVALGPDTTTPWADIYSELRRRSTEPQPPILTEFSGVSVLVADGLHRVHALNALADDTRFHVVHANLFVRRDGLAVTIGDCHTIGARQNGLDTKGRKTTAYDRVHTCLSTLQATLELSESQLRACRFFGKEKNAVLALRESPNANNLSRLLDVRGVSVVSGGRTQKRYCSVAIQLGRFEEATGVRAMLQEAMTKGKKELNCGLGIGVLENSLLWTAKSEQHFKYLLVCMVRLKKRLKLDDEKVDDIIARVDGLWQAVESELSSRGIEMERGLDLKVLIPSRGPGRDMPQLTESLLDRLKCWMSKLQLKQVTTVKLWRKRLSFLLKVLLKPETWPDADVFGTRVLGPSPKHVASADKSTDSASGIRSGASDGEDASKDTAQDVEMQLDDRDARQLPTKDGSTAQSPDIGAAPVAEGSNEGSMDMVTQSPKENVSTGQDAAPDEAPLVPDTQDDMPTLDPLPGQPVVNNHGDRDGDNELSTDVPEQHLGRNSRSQMRADNGKNRMKGSDTSRARLHRKSLPMKKGVCKRKTAALKHSKRKAGKSPATIPQSHRRVSKKKTASAANVSSSSEESASSQSSRSESETDDSEVVGVAPNIPVHTYPVTHLVRKTDPICWQDEIPPDTPVREDENGFRIVRRWKNGFEYKRPQQRDWGLRNVGYMPDKNNPLDGYWYGELPDGTQVNINGDTYFKKVTVPGEWTLMHLPRWDNPIWEQKYRVPYDCDSLIRPRFQHPGCKEALLRSMGFRPPHQSHFRLSLSDISQIRFSVFEYIFRGVIMPKHYSDWQPYADNVFRAHRHTLDQAGFIVFKGFMSRTSRDVSDTSTEGDYKKKYKWESMFQDVKELFKYLEKDIPMPETYDEDKKLRWSRIRNGRALPVDVPLQDSRWTSTPHCTNTALEKKEHQHLLKARCYVEVAIWVLVHWLHLEADDFDQIPEDVPDESADTPFPPLYATDSGSRALGTSTKCSDQVAHKDFVTPRHMFSGGFPGGMNNPPYFVLSTGSQGCKLYILPASHGWVFYTEEAKKQLSNVVGLVPVDIPPWSTLFARGDLIHAGVGNPAGAKGFFVRLHDFILRKYVPFLDQINDTVRFQLFQDLKNKVEESEK